ncbi:MULTISPECIES: allene oxide cyclase barrel-like domain-containing protein [Streptomyces]|uniref:Allene oxide cyclase barrel-like domain-containing protein n=2 Tax=Streptomyces TaxID=1883 RepID=A0ABS9J9V1_9ACTN|nr:MULTISPECIES: hypothetical protein [Streptomyces]MYU27775.1 hypothetical protein [Streptomyces sp. SID7810]CUW26640.1 hypothetical protein TUE45_01352 [Streptomyces reticuli]MCG0062324.1 hypothetical protein [Streptomyces tricolor]OYP19226.1 hypothetical protein CFC35_36025 [Streptomyces sp. FBKL.4005]BCM72004.1 hypothetical protein EASAB2608_07338 [Streptomyces sp. EAS-AB2608]
MPMKRFVAVSLAAATLGVLAVGSAGAADTAAAPKKRVEVLELKVENLQYESVDVGAAGPSQGDMNAFSGTTSRDGRIVGLGGGTCEVVRIEGDKQTSQCVITARLEKGSLTMQALWERGAPELEMAITGGTGVYKGASGTASYWDIATPDERIRAEIVR